MKSTKNEMEHFNVGYNKGFVAGYQQGKADGAKEFAEWIAECGKVSEPNKECTINRLLEDFAEWQKSKQ